MARETLTPWQNSLIRLWNKSGAVRSLVMAQYISTGINFVTTVMLARGLGVEGYGVYALILAFPSMIRSIVSVKTVSVSTRFLSAFAGEERWDAFVAIASLGYGLDFLAFSLAFVVVALGAPWVSREIAGGQALVWPMLIYAASFPPLSFRGGSIAVLTAFQAFGWIAGVYLAESLARMGVIGGILLSGGGPSEAVFGMALTQVGMGVGSLWLASYHMRRRGVPWPSLPSRKELQQWYREFLGLMGWNYGLTTLAGATVQIPIMMLGTRSEAMAGMYRLALNLINVLMYPVAEMRRVVYPYLSRQAFSRSLSLLHQHLLRWVRLGTLGGVLWWLLTSAGVLLGVPRVFGEDYRPAIPGILGMLMGAAFHFPLFWLQPFFFAIGNLKPWVVGYGGAALLFLAGLPWVARWKGIGGVGLWWGLVLQVGFLLSMVLYVFKSWDRLFSENRTK